jgi:NAD(P)-dependent dehydrogenase (short-subunit alcohol dehydrogenase family)
MSAHFDGKVAFITGANRGIGFETAQGLAKLGIHVVLAARDAAQGEAAVARLLQQGLHAEALTFDVSDPRSHQAAFDHLSRQYGHLDILVNNAGIALEELLGPNSTPVVTQEVLRGTFEVNFFAVVALTQTLLPLIRKAPAGRIVNLSSVLGSLSLHAAADSPIAGVKPFAYDASKAALNAFTIHLADALRDTPIKVNSAHPGWVRTAMGGEAAPMPVEGSGATSIALATLAQDGPSGGFFHLGEPLPW